MNRIGIMQGRLSPPMEKRLQFFPDNWQEEFSRAQKMGFDHIQWFLDCDHSRIHPIADIWESTPSLTAMDKVRKILPVSSIDAGRFSTFGPQAKKTVEQFKLLFSPAGKRLSTGVISLPLLEDLAPKTPEQKREAFETIEELTRHASEEGLRIALETEMPVEELVAFVDTFQEKNVGVCYDIGNCTSYGFNCPGDIKKLGKRIFEVHLKDRKIGNTQSVSLGSGDADFDGCFAALVENGYQGVYTLQTWRGTDYLGDALRQLQFAKKKLEKYL